MENESVTSKFFKNCLFEEGYFTDMRKPYLKNYLKQNDPETIKLFFKHFEKSLVSDDISPKKKS